MKYKNILSRIYNTPLCITEEKLLSITSNVTDHLLLDHEPSRSTDEKPTVNSFHSNPNTGVAVIGIYDALVSKGGLGASGFSSYQQIEDDANYYKNKGYSTIVFDLHTPGGEASGLFALINFISDLHKKDGIRTIGFTDGFAASAGYGIMSACSERYATEGAFVGSIGAIIDIVDFTKLNKKVGIQHNIIRSKPEKALGNPNEPVTDEIIAKFQATVDELDSIFNSKVLENNPKLSLETIIKTKGNMFIASKAKELNLIDGIVSHLSEVVGDLDSNLQSNSQSESILLIEENKMAQTSEQLQAENSKLEIENEKLKAEISNLTSKTQEMLTTAKEQEKARCLGILEAASTLGISPEATTKRIEKDSSLSDSVELFEAIAEHTGTSTGDLTETSLTSSISANDRIVKIGEDSLSPSAIIAAAKAG